jgi:hypothetical protein
MENSMAKIEELNALRMKAQEIPDTELSKKTKGETFNQHYAEINVNELIDVDLEIYRKFLDETLKQEELENYKKNVKRDSESRKFFMEWINNNLFLPKNMKWFDSETYKILYGE